MEKFSAQELTQEQKDKLEEIRQHMFAKDFERLKLGWRASFDERQRRLIDNCVLYAAKDPAGMPGHNLALIVAKMAAMLDERKG